MVWTTPQHHRNIVPKHCITLWRRLRHGHLIMVISACFSTGSCVGPTSRSSSSMSRRGSLVASCYKSAESNEVEWRAWETSLNPLAHAHAIYVRTHIKTNGRPMPWETHIIQTLGDKCVWIIFSADTRGPVPLVSPFSIHTDVSQCKGPNTYQGVRRCSLQCHGLLPSSHHCFCNPVIELGHWHIPALFIPTCTGPCRAMQCYTRIGAKGRRASLFIRPQVTCAVQTKMPGTSAGCLWHPPMLQRIPLIHGT